MTCSLLPYAGVPGVCDLDGTALTGRQKRWCSRRCESEHFAQHHWGAARKRAKKRDGGCVREGCSTPHDRLEVNHIAPRNGRGYGWDCAHHLDGLETLCHNHHVEVTREQRRAKIQEGVA